MKRVFIVAFIAIVSALVSCNQNAEIAKLTAQIDSLSVAVQQLQADQFEMKDQIQALQRKKSSSAQQAAPAAQSEPAPKASSAQEAPAKSKSETKTETKSETKAAAPAATASVSGYYMKIGTKSELKSAGLLDKNVIKKGVVNTEGLNMSIFKKIDIRSTREIKINAYKPKLLTSHPNKSYEMKLDDDAEEDITYLKIKDVDAFWSQSHFLVIQY